MAFRRWCGKAASVPQVATHTPASVGIGNTFSVTINSRVVTYTAAAATVADVCTGLVALLQISTFPEFREVTWTDNTTYIGSQGPGNGKPVTITTAAAGGTATFVSSVTTTSTGPNWVNNVANWKEAATPGAADDVVIDEGPSLLYGLETLDGATFASFRVGLGFPATSEIGLPSNTSPENPDLGYPEYLPQRFKFNATLVEIETNSPRIRLDLGTVVSTVAVNGTGQSRQNESGAHALDMIAVNSGTVVRLNKGDVGLATGAGEVSTVGTFSCAYRNNPGGDATAELGRGVTLTTLTQSGGNITLRCAATTVNRTGGYLNRVGTGTIGTLNNRGGQFDDDGTGTITQIYNSAEYNRRGLAPLTITDCTVYGGSRTRDPDGTITWTNAPQLFECSLSGGSNTGSENIAYFDFGRHRKITIAGI
jgi:hypothetical protein